MSDVYTPEAILQKLTTPEDCEQFAVNVQEKYPDVAVKAKRRAVELRAQQLDAPSEVERDALEVIFAYEAVLAERNGKKTSAARTWQMVKRYGILKAVERAVNRPMDASGFKALSEMGMNDLTFEALVLRHPAIFSADAVARCKKRLASYDSPETK